MVHLLRQSVEPVELALNPAGTAIPEWPKSTRFTLIGAIRSRGPLGRVRVFWPTTKEDADQLMTNHPCKILWFTVAIHKLTEDKIEKTLTGKGTAS